MHRSTTTGPARVAIIAALVTLSTTSVRAQGWAYPSFQPPRIVARELNFGIAHGGDAGTSLLVQWREQTSPSSQLSFDIGLADPKATGVDNVLFLGGQYAYQLSTATPDVPLDFLLTAGAHASFGDNTILRLPVGVSIGHRFPLEGTLALTPYVHPRASLDFCGGCKNDESQIGINFDVGANLELTRALALRVAALFGGSDRFGDNGIGFSIAWSPPGVRAAGTGNR
jgi:hypothetical protein